MKAKKISKAPRGEILSTGTLIEVVTRQDLSIVEKQR
jgi:hypothetical protein